LATLNAPLPSFLPSFRRFKKLAAQLGLDSVEELESIVDSMDGIAEDGGELQENLAREARVRASYMDWCKEFKKKQDEKRFQQFSANFLTMEDYANKSGEAMKLNEYADCTKEEYEALSKYTAGMQSATAQAPSNGMPIEDAALKAAMTAAAEALGNRAPGLAMAKEVTDSFVRESEERMAAINAANQAKYEAARKKKEEELKAMAQQDSERRMAIEKERADRQKVQEMAKAKAAESAEAAAIAGARMASEQEALRSGQRGQIEKQAAEMARQQAREAEARQKRLSKPRPVEEKKASGLGMFFAALPKPSSSTTRSSPTKDASSFSFMGSAGAAKSVPKPAPAKNRLAKPAPSSGTFSIFPPSVTKKVAPKSSPTPATKKSPTLSLFAPSPAPRKAAPARAPSPKAEPVFSFFSGSKSAVAPKKSSQVPAPAPKTEPSFSFFGTKPVASPKKASPAPAPAPKAEPSFSFFGTKPVEAPKKVPPAPAPAPKSSFSFFATKPVEAPKKAPQVPVPAPKAAPTFSFFGTKPVETPKKVTLAPAPAPKAEPSFSFFGTKPVTAAKKAAPAPAPVPVSKAAPSFFSSAPATATKKDVVKVPNQSGTISIFSAMGQSKTAPKKMQGGTISLVGTQKIAPKGVPTLSRWKQNPDGSITGTISGSTNFTAGQKITTSPVSEGAKPGLVVQTGSGSKYYLS
jgi:hypothetical protein